MFQSDTTDAPARTACAVRSQIGAPDIPRPAPDSAGHRAQPVQPQHPLIQAADEPASSCPPGQVEADRGDTECGPVDRHHAAIVDAKVAETEVSVGDPLGKRVQASHERLALVPDGGQAWCDVHRRPVQVTDGQALRELIVHVPRLASAVVAVVPTTKFECGFLRRWPALAGVLEVQGVVSDAEQARRSEARTVGQSPGLVGGELALPVCPVILCSRALGVRTFVQRFQRLADQVQLPATTQACADELDSAGGRPAAVVERLRGHTDDVGDVDACGSPDRTRDVRSPHDR